MCVFIECEPDHACARVNKTCFPLKTPGFNINARFNDALTQHSSYRIKCSAFWSDEWQHKLFDESCEIEHFSSVSLQGFPRKPAQPLLLVEKRGSLSWSCMSYLVFAFPKDHWICWSRKACRQRTRSPQRWRTLWQAWHFVSKISGISNVKFLNSFY